MGATVNTYSWNTSGLTLANSISGGSTFDLTFKWNTTNAPPTTNTVTLTVTDTHSNVVTQTYEFQLPSGSGGGTAIPTWPTELVPSYSTPLSTDYTDQYVGVNQVSGALDTTISLPSYNPNVTPVTLDYNSQAANPQPIVDVHHILDPTLSLPSQVQAQLSFDSSGGSTYTYNTSSFNPGDIQAIALQANASTLSTGRYGYTVTVADDRSSNTTFTYNDTTTVINDSGSALGAGWTVDGLESITSASGGVIVDLSDGQSLWFASSGSSYVTPANDPDFSTLAAVSGGGWTRTLKDGTVLTFNSGGQETKVVDLNSNTTTYSYSGGNLVTITDPYSKVTTFAYSSGVLSTITDPAGRVVTFTQSGGNLTQAVMPDGGTWDYAYSSHDLTKVTDPLSHAVTIAYDSSARVATISRPDSSTDTYTNAQEQGLGAGSTVTATLLAAAYGSMTDGRSNVTEDRPDWYGLGVVGQETDAIGDVSTFDYNTNGLTTVSIDQNGNAQSLLAMIQAATS